MQQEKGDAMGVIDSTFIAQATDIVGKDRIRSDARERHMYSVDIGVMPKLVRPFVNAGLAGAVVRPESEAQLTALIHLCNASDVPLVARGASTSGYGGVLPRNGALVVDMSGWDRVLDVDEKAKTACVEAGAVWEEVDRALAAHGLALRLHPSSYPSSTVGGWLAQGGSGFGSYEYGRFRDNVISARVIMPDGQMRVFSDEDLQTLVADAEGITGIITQVTFHVRTLEETVVRLTSFPDIGAIADAARDIAASALPLWSFTFLNPTSVKLKKELPGRACHAFEQEEVDAEIAAEQALPVSYLALMAYPASREAAIEKPLSDIVSLRDGTFLPDADARREWENRSASMRLKRLGPSIIPTEVIVPADELAGVIDEIDDKIAQPFVLEGMFGADGTVVLLGYIPHDERAFAFNPAFALSLSVVRIAEEHHGSIYATGLYFRPEAKIAHGPAKLDALDAFKDEHDPRHLMNPGKVFARAGEGGGGLDRLMGMARGMEGFVRRIANAARPKERAIEPARNGISGETALAALSCARCGYCVHTCEQYSGRGWESQSPRGKYLMIRDIYDGRDTWDRAGADTMLACTTCERCDARCQLQLPVEASGMGLRNSIVEEQGMGTFPPFEMMGAALHGEGDIWAGRRLHRADWLPEDVAGKIPEQSDILYFAGCTASYVETDIAEATLRLLQDAGLSVAYLGTEESCCGIPMKMAGKDELFAEVYERNVAAARAHGAHTIVTSCPACALVWKEFYAREAEKRGEPYEFEVKHYSELIAPALGDGTLSLPDNALAGHTVTFHDSCHAGRAQGIYEPPRDMLKAMPGLDYVEMAHNREEGICCGSVVTLVGEIETAPVLGCARLQEAVDAGADTVVALCPCCQVQLRDSASKAGLDIEIDDLARVVAASAGYDIPTSKEYATYAWSFFERFIVLMEPENMAKFMERIFPQMTDAMPAHMGPAMRKMAQGSGGRAMMARMMPALFPRMAPGILDKVMPDLVSEVAAYIGEMPEDMAYLMPDLLPQTMHELMPTYIPALVPYLVPSFIGYLKDGTVENEAA